MHSTPQNLRQRILFNQINRDLFVQAFVKELTPGAHVLDVGAGTGRYRELISKNCTYKAHDFASEPSTVGKYTALDYQSDICEIPVASETFDALICTEVLEHVPEPIRALNELSRILKKDGLLLLTAPLGSLLHQEPYHFYGGFTPHWYNSFLPSAGLAVLSIERNQGFFSFFGQEARRFWELTMPTRVSVRWYTPLWVLGWLAVTPLFLFVFPFLGPRLDRLHLEAIATVGYHVIARKT